jgi:hypothetical protein
MTYPLILTRDNRFHFNKLYHIKWMTILSAALAQVREALGLDVSLPERQKRESLEIADECSTQIASQSPNSTKLLNMFNVLGTAIQSIASAQPAYQALKIALLPLGIILP